MPCYVYFYDSMPESGCRFIYAGLAFLIIVNHAPPPESYFPLLSIVNQRSFLHPPNVGARYSCYVQMCTLGYHGVVLKNTDVIAGLMDLAKH